MTQSLRNPNYHLRDLLDLVKKELLLTLNCHAMAQIQSFDAETQTVTATILYKQAYEQRDPRTGKYSTVLVDYPLLIDAPAVVLGGGGGALTFPIQPGDECVILFNDRDIDNWFSGAPNGAVNSDRLHSMADGIALVGVRSLEKTLDDYDTERAALTFRTEGVVQGKIGVSSKILIKNATVDFKTQLDILLQALETAGTALGSAASFPQVNAAGVALEAATALVKVQMDLLFETEGP